LKDALEIIPVKVLFESTIVVFRSRQGGGYRSAPFILLISRRYGQDEMVDDDAFVELAKYCVRACYVLETATEGRDMDSLNGPTEEAIESSEKYVVPV